MSSKFNSNPSIDEPIPDFLRDFLTSTIPFSFSSEEMLLHELEMEYIHKYLTLLSAKVIDLIKNNYQDLKNIRLYENKLIEMLGLVYHFFQFGNNQDYFLQHFVMFSDELFLLLLYSDNFDLILQILMNFQIKFSYSFN